MCYTTWSFMGTVKDNCISSIRSRKGKALQVYCYRSEPCGRTRTSSFLQHRSTANGRSKSMRLLSHRHHFLPSHRWFPSPEIIDGWLHPFLKLQCQLGIYKIVVLAQYEYPIIFWWTQLRCVLFYGHAWVYLIDCLERVWRFLLSLCLRFWEVNLHLSWV